MWKPWSHFDTQIDRQLSGVCISKEDLFNCLYSKYDFFFYGQGCAFYSKPDVVLFKDFDVGKTYRKKVLITNVSYSQNYCQYIGVSDKLKDFIDIG